MFFLLYGFVPMQVVPTILSSDDKFLSINPLYTGKPLMNTITISEDGISSESALFV